MEIEHRERIEEASLGFKALGNDFNEVTAYKVTSGLVNMKGSELSLLRCSCLVYCIYRFLRESVSHARMYILMILQWLVVLRTFK